MDLAIVSGPAGREADGGVDILEGDREVDEEEVEVIQTPEPKLELSELFYLKSV